MQFDVFRLSLLARLSSRNCLARNYEEWMKKSLRLNGREFSFLITQKIFSRVFTSCTLNFISSRLTVVTFCLLVTRLIVCPFISITTCIGSLRETQETVSTHSKLILKFAFTFIAFRGFFFILISDESEIAGALCLMKTRFPVSPLISEIICFMLM